MTEPCSHRDKDYLHVQAAPFKGAFENFSQVLVPYCSGDLWLGWASQVGGRQ